MSVPARTGTPVLFVTGFPDKFACLAVFGPTRPFFANASPVAAAREAGAVSNKKPFPAWSGQGMQKMGPLPQQIRCF
jgi:hypothetical protein